MLFLKRWTGKGAGLPKGKNIDLPRRSEMGRDGIHRAVANRLPPVLFYIVSKFDYVILIPIMDEDKRAAPRFLFSEPVAYGSSDVTVNGSIAGNISLSGVSLRVQGFVPIGAILELQIRLGKSPKIIWTKAQVVRIREVLSEDCYGIGLKFVKDEECIKAVGKYINDCRSKSTKE